MNNLSENAKNAKQAYFDAQQNKMLAQYQNANATERAAVIRQIDGFLSSLTGDEKSFWLSFRLKLERLAEGEIFNLIAWNDGKKLIFDQLTGHITRLARDFARLTGSRQSKVIDRYRSLIASENDKGIRAIYQTIFEVLQEAANRA